MSSLTEDFNILGVFDNTNTPVSVGYSVELPLIYKNLTLSDFIYSRSNINNKTMIINLCEERLFEKKID